VSVTAHDDGTLSVSADRLTAPDLDDLLQVLAEARGRMVPPVPIDIEDVVRADGSITSVREPDIALSRSADGHIVLCLRHQGFGWFAFELPDRQATFIHGAIGKRLAGVQVESLDEESPKPDAPQH